MESSHKLPILNVLYLIILIFSNIFVYTPAIKGDFISDDTFLIKNGSAIHSPHFLKHFLTFVFSPSGTRAKQNSTQDKKDEFYRPLVQLSYWIDYQIWGLNPAAFHLSNILLHIGCSIFLFFLLLRLTRNSMISFASSLLFSFFPTNFESVAWISGRTDIIALFFLLLSAHFFINFWRSGHIASIYLWSLLFLCGLLAKETAILTLFLFIYLAITRKSEKARHVNFHFIIATLLTSFSYLYLRFTAVGLNTTISKSSYHITDFFSALGFYAGHLFFPYLQVISPPENTILISPGYFCLGLGICLAIVVGSFYFLFSKRLPTSCFVLFCLTMLLILPSVMVLFIGVGSAPLAWRFLYMPHAISGFMFVLFVFQQLKKKIAQLTIIIIVGLFIIIQSPFIELFGQSERDFWLKLPRPEKESSLYQMNHAFQLLAVDENQALVIFNGLLERQSKEFLEKFEFSILVSCASYFTNTNKLEKAEFYFSSLFKKHYPHSVYLDLNFAIYMAKRGNISEAKTIARPYLENLPDDFYILSMAADFYLATNNRNEALIVLLKIQQFFPSHQILKKIQTVQSLIKVNKTTA